MNTEKISALQMGILMYPTIIATAILSFQSAVAQYVGNSIWMPPLFASSFGFISLALAIKLHSLYEGKNVIEYSEEITGKIIGKVIGFTFIFIYLHSTGEIVRAYSEFIISSFLFNTPQIFTISSMILLCGFGIASGIEVLARVGQFMFPFLTIPLLLLPFFLIQDMKFGNIFPIFDVDVESLIKASIIDGGLFSEFFMVSFFLPFLADRKNAWKFGSFSILSVMLTLFFTNLICLFVLGNVTAFKIYPLMNVSRYVTIGGFFDNTESVVMAIWIIGAFLKISVFFYVTVLAAAKWLNVSDYRPLIWPIGILIVQTAYWGLPNTMAFNQYATLIFPIYATFFQILVPFLLLMIALLKRKKASNSNR